MTRLEISTLEIARLEMSDLEMKSFREFGMALLGHRTFQLIVRVVDVQLAARFAAIIPCSSCCKQVKPSFAICLDIIYGYGFLTLLYRCGKTHLMTSWFPILR